MRKPRAGNRLLATTAAAAAVGWVAIGVTIGGAQQTTSPLPVFEVASVKPSPAGSKGQTAASRSWGDVTGRVSVLHVPLQYILTRVYDVKPYQISGPPWLTTEFYDIVANVPAGAPKEQISLMFQSLLAERFKLKLHRETQMATVYALVVSKGGAKLQEVPPESETPNSAAKGGVQLGGRGENRTFSGMIRGGPFGDIQLSMANGVQHFEFFKVTTKGLAEFLSQGMVALPVVDMTELKGFYHVPLDISQTDLLAANATQVNQGDTGQSPPTASDPPGGSVFESLQRIGLKLEHQKAPMEKFVIDHVEKVPTEN